jgi:hypothetical protein
MPRPQKSALGSYLLLGIVDTDGSDACLPSTLRSPAVRVRKCRLPPCDVSSSTLGHRGIALRKLRLLWVFTGLHPSRRDEWQYRKAVTCHANYSIPRSLFGVTAAPWQSFVTHSMWHRALR